MSTKCKFCSSLSINKSALDKYGRCPICQINSYTDTKGTYVLVYDPKSVMEAKELRGKHKKNLDAIVKFKQIYI